MLVAIEEGVIGLDDEIEDRPAGLHAPSPAQPRRRVPVRRPRHRSALPNGPAGIRTPGSRSPPRSLERATGDDDRRLPRPRPCSARWRCRTPHSAARLPMARHGTVADLRRFVARTASTPTLISGTTRDDAFHEHVPGAERYRSGRGPLRTVPLGVGVRDSAVRSHRTGPDNTIRRAPSATSAGPARCSGSTPTSIVGVVALTDETFGPWALDAWPALSDAVDRGVRLVTGRSTLQPRRPCALGDGRRRRSAAGAVRLRRRGDRRRTVRSW